MTKYKMIYYFFKENLKVNNVENFPKEITEHKQ